jgi:hypothetical protein
MYDAQTPRLTHSPHANGFAWSGLGDQNQSPRRNCRVDSNAKLGASARLLQAGFEPGPTSQLQTSAASCITRRAGRIRTRSYKSVADQRCQLYHYDVVVIQLAAAALVCN